MFSDAENLPSVASLCLWQRCVYTNTHLRINTLTHLYAHNGTEEQRRSPEIEQGAEKEPGRDRKIQRLAV